MELFSIETGRFKLDGGAMFGVVPKTIWQKTNPADANNRIDMAMRCLLVQDGNRLVLIDVGIGHKYNEKFAGLYDIDHRQTLESSLRAAGFAPEDVTDLVLTHMHFDHCGGAIARNAAGELVPTFPNADIWVQRSHLDWALNPNAREVASFLADNIQPLAQSPRLRLLDGPATLFPGFDLLVVNGHTEGQQLPLITHKGRQLLYAADLFPTYGHLPVPYVMGYDTRPLLTLDERATLLRRIVDEQITLFYEHDPYNECGTVHETAPGKFTSAQTFALAHWL